MCPLVKLQQMILMQCTFCNPAVDIRCFFSVNYCKLDICRSELAHSPLAGMNLTVTLDGHVIAVGKGLVEKWRVYVGTAVHGIFLVDSTHPQANPKR